MGEAVPEKGTCKGLPWSVAWGMLRGLTVGTESSWQKRAASVAIQGWVGVVWTISSPEKEAPEALHVAAAEGELAVRGRVQGLCLPGTFPALEPNFPVGTEPLSWHSVMALNLAKA